MIRKATKEDLSIITEIEKYSFESSDRFSSRVIRYHIKKEKTFVITKDGTVIGYMILVYYKSNIRIYSIAILPQFRKKGYGTKLILHALDIAKKMHKKYLSLEVNVHNKRAIALYETIGFIKQCRIQKYYHGKVDAYKMHRFVKNGNIG